MLVGKLFEAVGFCVPETLEAAVRGVIPARKASLLDKNLAALELGKSA